VAILHGKTDEAEIIEKIAGEPVEIPCSGGRPVFDSIGNDAGFAGAGLEICLDFIGLASR
jgi:hypothetical protein